MYVYFKIYIDVYVYTLLKIRRKHYILEYYS